MRISTDIIQTLDENRIDVSSGWLWVDADSYDSSYRQVLTQPISLEAITLDFLRWKTQTITLTIRDGHSSSSDVIFSGEAALIDDAQGGGAGAVSSVFGRTGDVVASENDYSSFYAKSDLVSKAGHGFAVGEPVRLDIDSLGAQTWSSAYATADLAHTATHYVVAVVDANTFRAANSGYWPISPASPVYGQQILGDAAGSVVASVSALPSGVGIQPLGMLDSTGLHINITSYVRDVTP